MSGGAALEGVHSHRSSHGRQHPDAAASVKPSRGASKGELELGRVVEADRGKIADSR